jgi:tetratricopeptide (TPR) repeat protein
MSRRTLLLSLAAAAVLAAGAAAWIFLGSGSGRSHGPGDLEPFTLAQRPQSDRYLFDYARVLSHYDEAAHRYLDHLASRFHIEALIVSVPALPSGHSPETLAVDLVNRWRVGAEHEGRGLLLLLVDDSRQVKLEVGYELEDVFTDAFAGYVEDLQLGPAYRGGDIGTGLVAVMEELERRARTRAQGGYTPGQIARADAALLAGGAGAGRDLARYGAAQTAPGEAGTGAGSPREAWEVMLAKWAGEGGDIETDPYTAMTRLAMGDPDRPDPRAVEWLDHWRAADYEVLRRGDHAVIWFGAVDGWQNAPFLFCNTGEGWKFDIVHQRRLVVMAENPRWQVAQGPYPYVGLMAAARQSTAKDLPLSGEDLYRCADDAAIAGRMAELEAALADDPDDPDVVIELMRLNVITGRRPNHVRPLIERATRLAPERPEPYRYAAIYNVNSFLQYRTALEEIDRYMKLRPDDPFGPSLKGFVLYRLGEYEASLSALEDALALDPDNGYAYALMARDYTLLLRKAKGLMKDHYRDRALEMRRRAAAVASPDARRLARLDAWMKGRL